MRLGVKSNADELYTVVSNNLKHLEEWLPWATKNYSLDSALEFIKTSRQQFADNKHENLLIFLENKLVGGIGLNDFNWSNKSVEIGYWLAENVQGKGIITKCCGKLIEYCFKELKLNRIVIRCAAENIKSQKIPERLKFTKESTLREALLLNDRFVDLIVYSMLKEEWR
jgi:ribosomal-protein-serine acetyltransferase